MSFFVRTLFDAVHCQPGVISSVSLLPVANVELSAVENATAPRFVVVLKSTANDDAVKPPGSAFSVVSALNRLSQSMVWVPVPTWVVVLADTSPLSNEGLGAADNAAFGVALAGGTPVAFLETVHGYGVSRGFGGLPTEVKWTLLGLLLTSLVAVWAAGRRFGPPEDPDTDPPPPRVEYVEALAGSLARTKPDKEKS